MYCKLWNENAGHTLRAGQFIEFINPWKKWGHRMKLCELREYQWNEYMTITVESQFKQLQNSPKKSFSGLQQDSNPWPLRSHCSALPAELWSPIHWGQAILLSSSTMIERNEAQNEMMSSAGIQMKWRCHHCSSVYGLNTRIFWGLKFLLGIKYFKNYCIDNSHLL